MFLKFKATTGGFSDVVKLLIKAGANPCEEDNVCFKIIVIFIL